MVKFLLERPEDDAGKAGPAIMIGLFVAFGGILYGCVRNSSFLPLHGAFSNIRCINWARGLYLCGRQKHRC